MLALLLSPTLINSQSPTGSPDPFAFFSSTFQINASDRQRIERGETIVNIVPAEGHEISIVAITQTTMSPERLVQWSSDIEKLKATPQVLRVKRLSAKPALDEFSQLTLPDADIRDVRSCHPESCNVKLTAAEIARMRGEMQKGGAGWLERGNAVFREIAHERVAAYLAGGLGALAPYADGHGESSRTLAFATIVGNSSFLLNAPSFRPLLNQPVASGPGVVSFTYWSVEQLGAKAVASATQTIIERSASTDPSVPTVLIAGKQIYATHYSSGSLNLVALVRRPAASGPPYYLVAVNRSSIDAIGGLFGGIARKVIEGRMRRDAPGIIATLRQRIEAGPPR